MPNFPRYLLNPADRTLDLGEPGIRVIDATTKAHVASVLPNREGFYDMNSARVLVDIHSQH